MLRLLYALLLATAGLLLITFRERIADFRNSGIDEEHNRWGEATSRRYLVFGVLFLLLSILSVLPL